MEAKFGDRIESYLQTLPFKEHIGKHNIKIYKNHILIEFEKFLNEKLQLINDMDLSKYERLFTLPAIALLNDLKDELKDEQG